MAKIVRLEHLINAHDLRQKINELFALLKANGHRSFYDECLHIHPYILEDLAAWEPMARRERASQKMFGEGLSEDDYREIVGILEEDYIRHHLADCNEVGEAPEEDPTAGLSIVDAADWKDGYEDPEWANVVFFNRRIPKAKPYDASPLSRLLSQISTVPD